MSDSNEEENLKNKTEPKIFEIQVSANSFKAQKVF